ncbi:MAG: hypothetical protein V4501_08020 [Pseudomonadota bacterium]
MKLTRLVTGIIAALISNNCLAAPGAPQKCASSMGNVIIAQVTLGCMSINGSASLTGTTFTGDLILTGPLRASGVKFQGLNVTGPVSLESSQIAGEAHIIGALSVMSSTFNKKLTVNAVDILLNGTTTKDIIIESSQPSTLLLTDTTVNGNVIFSKAHGTVTNKNSTIKGKVTQP